MDLDSGWVGVSAGGFSGCKEGGLLLGMSVAGTRGAGAPSAAVHGTDAGAASPVLPLLLLEVLLARLLSGLWTQRASSALGAPHPCSLCLGRFW